MRETVSAVFHVFDGTGGSYVGERSSNGSAATRLPSRLGNAPHIADARRCRPICFATTIVHSSTRSALIVLTAGVRNHDGLRHSIFPRGRARAGFGRAVLLPMRSSSAARADELGYQHVRTIEHYFHPYGGYSPNPLLFLTAVAARTQRVRLVTGAVLPAFNHPLKLAGEIGMLDAISHGRVEVGFARAFLPHEFRRFGVSLDDSRARFDEGLETVRRPARRRGRRLRRALSRVSADDLAPAADPAPAAAVLGRCDRNRSIVRQRRTSRAWNHGDPAWRAEHAAAARCVP